MASLCGTLKIASRTTTRKPHTISYRPCRETIDLRAILKYVEIQSLKLDAKAVFLNNLQRSHSTIKKAMFKHGFQRYISNSIDPEGRDSTVFHAWVTYIIRDVIQWWIDIFPGQS